MTETHRPRLILRRIGAVLAGFLAIFILSIATDVALHATGVFPPWGQPTSGAKLLLVDAERRVCEQIVPVDERVHPFLTKERAELLHLRTGAVEGRHRLFRGAILHQLENAKESDRADIAY